MTYTEIVSKRILYYCKKKGISFNKLATLSGLGSSTIDNIIKKKTKIPNLRSVHRIAQGFDMTISEFLDFPEMNETEFEDE